VKGVVFDFAESRGGRHAGAFLGDWRGTLVCDDYSGYVVPKFMLRHQLVAEGTGSI